MISRGCVVLWPVLAVVETADSKTGKWSCLCPPNSTFLIPGIRLLPWWLLFKTQGHSPLKAQVHLLKPICGKLSHRMLFHRLSHLNDLKGHQQHRRNVRERHPLTQPHRGFHTTKSNQLALTPRPSEFKERATSEFPPSEEDLGFFPLKCFL